MTLLRESRECGPDEERFCRAARKASDLEGVLGALGARLLITNCEWVWQSSEASLLVYTQEGGLLTGVEEFLLILQERLCIGAILDRFYISISYSRSVNGREAEVRADPERSIDLVRCTLLLAHCELLPVALVRGSEASPGQRERGQRRTMGRPIISFSGTGPQRRESAEA